MPKAVDLSEFEVHARKTGTQCGVARMVLEGERKEKFEAAMEDAGISARVINVVLKEWGYDVGDQVVNRHRRGLCSCGK